MNNIVYCEMCGDLIEHPGNSLRKYCDHCKSIRKNEYNKKNNNKTKTYCVKCGKAKETYNSKVCKPCKTEILKTTNKYRRMGKILYFCYSCGKFVREKTKKGECAVCRYKRSLKKEETEYKYSPKMKMPPFIRNLRKSKHEKNQIFQEYLVHGNIAARKMIQIGVKKYREKYFNKKLPIKE